MSSLPRVERMLMHANLHVISCCRSCERSLARKHELHMRCSQPFRVFSPPLMHFPRSLRRFPSSPAGIKAYLYHRSAYGVTAAFGRRYHAVGNDTVKLSGEKTSEAPTRLTGRPGGFEFGTRTAIAFIGKLVTALVEHADHHAHPLSARAAVADRLG